MKVAFIGAGQFWKRGEDGVFRNKAGVAYEDRPSNQSPQRAITRDYEHVMLEWPDWKPSFPGEKPPYPHLVPSQRKGYYKGAMTSRREVEEFSARTGKKWGSP